MEKSQVPNGRDFTIEDWNRFLGNGSSAADDDDYSDLLYNLWLFNNTSNSNSTNEYFVIPTWRFALWLASFSLMVLTSVIGNGIVIWIVLTDKKMRTPVNYFLVNLAVSDMTLSTLNTVFSFVSMATHNWPFGETMCTVTQYVAVLSVACSSFTLIAISVERYLAVVHPLRNRMAKLATLVCISTIWLMSVLIALPHLIYASLDLADEHDRHICQLYWPDGPTFESLQEYNVVLTSATYIIPIAVVICLYMKIILKLRASEVIGETTVQQLKLIQSKRKIIKMLIIVVGIFSMCWLPYHVYFLVSWIYRPINEWSYIQEVYLAIYWLAMSSSMYNPIIYCWMNSKFKTGCKRVVTRLLCCCTVAPRDTAV